MTRIILMCIALVGSSSGQADGGWGVPELVGPGVVSTTGIEFNTTISPSGTTLVTTRFDSQTQVGSIEALEQVDEVWQTVDYFNGMLTGVDGGDGHLSRDGSLFLFYRDADVWEMRRGEDGRWQAPSKVDKPISTAEHEAYPTLSAAKSLCFTRMSDGNWDIYMSAWSGDVWETPERLPAPVNTKYREHDALVFPDGNRLIFVRMGDPQGPGMSDLYMCTKENGEWTEPELLGFNSPEIDGSPCLSPDGAWLYFTSGRPTGTDQAAGLCIWRIRTPWAEVESDDAAHGS